jgi:uncharacterized protein with FMN-binding domain
MKTTRMFLVAGSSATLLAVGYAAAPKTLPSSEVGQPANPGDGAVIGDRSDLNYQDGVYDGPRVTNIRGGYQAQITVEGGFIISVSALEAGTSAPQSVQVNSFAVPTIVERVLLAQSADVEHVSGSSYTSPALIESIDAALEKALP